MDRVQFRFRLLGFVFQSGGGEDFGQLPAAIALVGLIFLKIQARPLTVALSAAVDRPETCHSSCLMAGVDVSGYQGSLAYERRSS